MASVAMTIFVALLVLGIIKLIQKYWNDLKFSKDFCGPALPIPLIGQVLPTLVFSWQIMNFLKLVENHIYKIDIISKYLQINLAI